MATKTEKPEKTDKPERRSRRQAQKSNRPQSNAFVRYLRETRGELRKVTWPTWEETWRLSLIVLGVSAVTAVFLGLILDTLFSSGIRGIINVVLGI